jgi:RNA polymerase sigma factor (sigma-70 family)
MPPPPAEPFASRIFLGPALRAQPDRRLVDLVRDGYDAAFEEIVRRYRRPLDRFAAAIVGGRSEDVTQDAFSKALLALRGSEAEIELRPWLYRIVRNTALNDLRDRAPAAEELSETLPGGRSAAAEAEAREELRDLMDRLGALPEPQRAALVMRELEGLSHEEIAAALGVSGGAARQAIYRARAALREGLGLLVPLPALRMFVEHGAEMVKAGAATVLIAGTVGAGVAIEHHHAGRSSPETAEAAPLLARKHSRRSTDLTPAPGSSSSPEARGHGTGRNVDQAPGDNRSDASGSLGGEIRSGSSDDSGPASSDSPADGSKPSGEGSHHSGSGGPGPNSGSGSGDHHGSNSGSDDFSGSNSGSGSRGDDGGSSGGSGSDGGSISGDGGDSGFDDGGGGDDVVSEPTTEPTLSESSEDGGSSDGSGSDGETSGSGSSGGGDSLSGSSTTSEGSS